MATTKVKSETKTTRVTQAKTATRVARKSTASKSMTTTNHDEIRAWAEKRKGVPAMVKGTAKAHGTGILRIDFPGYSGKDTLEKIEWEDFFKKFDDNKLEFLYQEQTATGRNSRFNKFVSKQ